MKQLKTVLRRFFVLVGILIAYVIVFHTYRDIPLQELKDKYTNEASEFVSVMGMNVHYRDEGIKEDSIPIVLIHGTGSSLHTFEDWVSVLKKERRVLTMDIPAYGLTGPFPDRDYSTGHYVEFINEFIKTLGIEQCVLGGNSLGGRIAWSFALEYPEAIDKLILIDASGYPAKDSNTPLAFRMAEVPLINNIFKYVTPKFVARSSVETCYADNSKVSDELAERYFELTLREGNRQAFVDRLVAGHDTSAYHRISDIQHPTLVLWGDKDELFPEEHAHRFSEDLANDTLVIMKDIGHVPMEESPMESVQAVLSFLKRN